MSYIEGPTDSRDKKGNEVVTNIINVRQDKENKTDV